LGKNCTFSETDIGKAFAKEVRSVNARCSQQHGHIACAVGRGGCLIQNFSV